MLLQNLWDPLFLIQSIQKGYWYLTSACLSKSPILSFYQSMYIKGPFFHFALTDVALLFVLSPCSATTAGGAGRVSASEAGAHTECRGPGPGVAISPHKHVTGHPGSHHTEKNNPPSKSTLVFLTFRKYVTRRLTLSCFHVRQCGMLWLGNNREMFLIIWSTLIEKIGSGTGINPWI